MPQVMIETLEPDHEESRRVRGQMPLVSRYGYKAMRGLSQMGLRFMHEDWRSILHRLC